MKIFARILLISMVVLSFGCGKNSDAVDLSGKWQGSFTEKGKSTAVELNLNSKEGQIEGTFKILSETGEDIGKGMSFKIVRVSHSDNKLKFIVPITGKVDNDAIEFELLIEGSQLKGHGHELRKGSKKIPITFTKK